MEVEYSRWGRGGGGGGMLVVEGQNRKGWLFSITNNRIDKEGRMEKHTWHRVHLNLHSNNQPAPRWGHSCCVIGNEIVYFGGYAQSVYMNDVWSFNTTTMEWNEIKTTGDVPSHRSNCSMSYDSENDRIVVFGGGGPNKKRFNTINVLNWITKEWIEIPPKEDQPSPWERTYHSAELVYPYLVVYGGEGVADMNDLWVFNFLTLSWTEVPIDKNSTRPCARRFHSSALMGTQFFVIGGCHGKYRCLSDVYSLNLAPLLEGKGVESLEWVQHNPSGAAFLTRWGHTSAVYDSKIHIFGGRFSNDLNDLLVLDLEKNEIKALKIAQEPPKARRRHSACFIGSCMLIFGGFNGEYYNDLYYINVFELKTRLQVPSSPRDHNCSKMVNNKSFSDCQVTTIEGEQFHLHKGLLVGSLGSEEKFAQFLEKANKKFSKTELEQLIFKLYRGFGTISKEVRAEYSINLCETQQERDDYFKEVILMSETQRPSLGKRKSIQTVTQVHDDEHFGNFLDNNRSHTYKDSTLVINDTYCLPTNKTALAMSSQYFRCLFSGNYKGKNSVHVRLSNTNLVIFEMIVNYLLLDRLVVPSDMGIGSWMELYEMAEFLCLGRLMTICEQHLCSLVHEENCDQIFSFAVEVQAETLALYCADYLIKCMVNRQDRYFYDEYSCQSKNEVLEVIYNLARFDILQVKLERIKLIEDGLKRKESQSTQEEKENYEIN